MPHQLLLCVPPVTRFLCQNEVLAEQALPHSQCGSWTADQRAFKLCYYIPDEGQTKGQTIDHKNASSATYFLTYQLTFFLVFIMISEPHDLFPGLCVLEVPITIRFFPEVQAWSIWMFPVVLRYISKLVIDMKLYQK